MDLKTFFEHFDTLAEAPNGLQRLRELILDMAVRGKLVPQDPEDEPARLLLKNIQADKEELYSTKVLRRQKPIPRIEISEHDFPVPSNWEWSRLGEIAIQITDGTHHTPSYQSSGVPFISVKDISSGKLNFLNTKFISKEEHIEINQRCNPEKGDILICRIGTLGKAVVVNTDKPFSLFVSVGLIKLSPDTNSTFLVYALNSPFLNAQYEEIKAGGSHTNKLNLRDIPTLRIPLPPLAEQKRIVAKVDELMALCDTLEAAQQTRNTLRQSLRASALDALMNATSDTELETAWAFVRDNWAELSRVPEDVEGLRKVVLEAASRGRLALQVPSEGSGEGVLIKSIQEREELSQKDLAQKPKPHIPVSDEEHPFRVPPSWIWARIEDICTHIVDCLHRTPKYQAEGYPAIRTSEMQPGRILYEKAKCVGEEEYQRQTQRLVPKAGDIFYSREGNYGIAAVVPSGIEMCLSQRMMQFRLTSNIYPDFFSWMMNSAVVFDQADADAAGMTVPHINIRALRKFVFPLPPLAEQKRIVAKVDELMKLCDQLEESLRRQHQGAEKLSKSILSHQEI
jgi:type I restriction enzyme S subunit